MMLRIASPRPEENLRMTRRDLRQMKARDIRARRKGVLTPAVSAAATRAVTLAVGAFTLGAGIAHAQVFLAPILEPPYALTYRARFNDLFGDCGKLMEAYRDERPAFGDLALHAFLYDRACP